MHRIIFACLLALAVTPALASNPLARALQQLAPDANPKVIQLAVHATHCALAKGQPAADKLAIIDYSLPSTSKRLWVFDLKHRDLDYHELVAHGMRTGKNYAVRFSNRRSSHESSLGLYRTLNPYYGRNGYSLRLQGLEPGFNSNAYSRGIVVHGADYVSRSFINDNGRLGRSWGCPAVRESVTRSLINTLKGGNYLFAYYPNKAWLNQSKFLNCDDDLRIASAD